MKKLVRHHHVKLTSDEAEQICRITIVFNILSVGLLCLFAMISFLTGDKIHGVILTTDMGITLINIVFFLLSGQMSPLILITDDSDGHFRRNAGIFTMVRPAETF